MDGYENEKDAWIQKRLLYSNNFVLANIQWFFSNQCQFKVVSYLIHDRFQYDFGLVVIIIRINTIEKYQYKFALSYIMYILKTPPLITFSLPTVCTLQLLLVVETLNKKLLAGLPVRQCQSVWANITSINF